MDYENENEFSALLDILQSSVTDAYSVPMSKGKCMLPREKTLELIEEIKRQYPIELTEANRLISSKDDFISNAKREAESIRKTAEEQARHLVEEEEVTRMARAHAKQLVSGAEEKARELIRVANEYVDDALGRTEEAIASAGNEIRQSRVKFRNLASNRDVSHSNHEEMLTQPVAQDDISEE